MKKFSILFFLAVIMAFASIPASADWNSTDVTMTVGETKTLYLPSSVTSKTLKSAQFYSASINVVQVVSHSPYSVRVKAVKASSVPVVVRCDYYYYVQYGYSALQMKGAYDFLITVLPVSATSITIPYQISLELGQSQTITPTITPSDAECNLTWETGNSSIATVSQDGTVMAKSPGETTLTVRTNNGLSATSWITVTPPEPICITIAESPTMTVGETVQLTHRVIPSNAEYTLSWTSDNPDVASVTIDGLVTARSEGVANIKVTTDNDKTDICQIKVNAPKKPNYTIKYHVIEGGGKVVCGRDTLIGLDSLVASEGDDVEFLVLPDSGYTVDRLTVDYIDVDDQLSDNVLVLDDIRKDLFLVVSFQENKLTHVASATTYSPRELEEQNATVYDLSGRRISPSQMKKGIYIVNGKKVLIR